MSTTAAEYAAREISDLLASADIARAESIQMVGKLPSKSPSLEAAAIVRALNGLQDSVQALVTAVRLERIS